jgi:hypothetical protein
MVSSMMNRLAIIASMFQNEATFESTGSPMILTNNPQVRTQISSNKIAPGPTKPMLPED